MSLLDAIEALFLPRRALGPLTAYVPVEEVATDEMEITQHPVQRGAAISDHAFRKPTTLTLSIMFGADEKPLSEVYEGLLAMKTAAEPIDVVTGKRSYKNMLIRSVRQTTDEATENVLAVSVDLQEVFIAEVEVVAVPERARQASPEKTGATENAGKKQAEGLDGASGANEARSRSALAALSGL